MFIETNFEGYGELGSRFSRARRKAGRAVTKVASKAVKLSSAPIKLVSKGLQKVKPLASLTRSVERTVLLPNNLIQTQIAPRSERKGYREEAKKGAKAAAIAAAVVATAGVATGAIAVPAGVKTAAITGAKLAGKKVLAPMVVERAKKALLPTQREQEPEQQEASPVTSLQVSPTEFSKASITPDVRGGGDSFFKGNIKGIPIWMIGVVIASFIYMVIEGKSRVRA